jgi:hypothetical protein
MVARTPSAHEIVGRQRELVDIETFLDLALDRARTFVIAGDAGPGAGVAVIAHEQGDAVVQTLSYAGRPHGVAFVRP